MRLQGGTKTRYEVVVTNDGREMVVFSSVSKPTAESVGKQYPGSVVREVPPKNTTETSPQ